MVSRDPSFREKLPAPRGSRAASFADQLAKDPSRLSREFIRIDTASPRFIAPEAKQYLSQLAVLPAHAAGGPRFRETQRTLDIQKRPPLYGGDGTQARVLWSMVDTRTNQLVAASVLHSGGFGNGPTSGIRRDPSARGNDRWDTAPILGRLGLGWLLPGTEGRMPDRTDKPEFKRDDGGGASWSLGLHPDAQLASLDGKERSLLREHYGDTITNGCLTGPPHTLDVLNKARAYALGAGLKPGERDPKKLVATGLAAIVKIHAIAEAHGGNQRAARAQIERELPGALKALPLQRDVINHALLSPAVVTAMARQWDKPPTALAEKKPEAPAKESVRAAAALKPAPKEESGLSRYIRIMTDSLSR